MSKDLYLCQCPPIEFSKDVPHEVFKSNGFPKNYCNNQHCIYEIEGKENSVIIVNIEHFDIEPTHDYVEIYHTQMYNGEHIKVKGQVLTGSGHAAKQVKSSIGGGLIFIFNTDNSENDYAGFRMSFTRLDQTKMANDGCNLPFVFVNNTEERSISLPRSKYTMETVCVYQFNSTNYIELNIKKLSQGMDIKVYETENFDSKNPDRSKLFAYSFFTLSINNTNKIIQSRTNSLTLILNIVGKINNITTSDLLITYKEIENPCRCPSEEIIMNKGEQISYVSPGFPGNYCDNLNCTTKIKLSNDNRNDNNYQVIFNKLDMEKEMDYISFGIGDVSLIKFSDANKGNSLTKFTYKRENPIIKTITDHSITMEGYNLTIVALNESDTCECYNRKQLETINSIIGDITMVIDKNCKYIDCFLNITQDEFKERHKVNIAISSNIGESDFIEITSGDNNAHNIDSYRLTGLTYSYKTTNEYFFENAQNILIWFHRDKPNFDTKVTINIQYNFNVLCACPSYKLTAIEGVWNTLTSPDYPQHYCNDLTCRHLIEAPIGYRVIVNVTNVSTEMNHDKLVLFDGDNINTTHIELLTGLVTMNDFIRSKSSQMTIFFESDTSITGKGYSLLYSAEMISDKNSLHSNIFSRNFFIFLLFIIIIGCFGYIYYKKKNFTYLTPVTYQNFSRPDEILRFRNINHSETRTNLI
ncbi:CUB domain-containing protein [Strongyloides ratti]|uniref:CUB domain-containing protein n=1 Tax=Strongyloides ratti TaxID=34506 RepID=A0A090MP10_STRRB|nr:CUB domain-containing protein [Strongyloides ratti]CEF59821.1 CUB domain-containing protein [Strongyloides ratti]